MSGTVVLLDTGPLVALLSRRDNAHQRARTQFAALSDACLIRMSEQFEYCLMLTPDPDFHVYRRRRRRTIPVLRPERYTPVPNP